MCSKGGIIEVWKDVKGYEGIYQVSNKGMVKSLDRKIKYKRKNKVFYRKYKEKQLSFTTNKDGYFIVNLSKFSKARKEYVHRVVALNFLENKFGKLTVNHIDGNKKNNQVENLEWTTIQENLKHARETGLIKRGTTTDIFAKNRKEYLRIYREQNKEKIRKQQKEWYQRKRLKEESEKDLQW